LIKSSTYLGFQFFLICLSSYLFFASFNMIIPELPGHLASMGGEKYKGWIIALFTLTAGISRPFSGKLTDRAGRIPAMIFGSVVCFIAGFLYPFALTVFTFLLLRLFHGFSTGFKPTGTAAYVADLSPPEKRGEAMGVQGFFGSIGMASGPILGSFLADHYSINTMFVVSSLFALASVIVILGMKETLPNPQKFNLKVFKISKSDLLEPAVFPAAVVILLNVFAYGVVLTLIPDLSIHLGIKNKGLYFAIFTIFSLLVRILGGKASDKYGRIPVLFVSAILITMALFFTALATESKLMFYISAAVYGLGLGINTPTAFAWTVDLISENIRGKGLATSYIAMEMGIGLGAVFSGYIYNGNTDNFFKTFLTASLMSVSSIIFLWIYLARKKRSIRQTVHVEESEFENVF
jgi:MFS family permease